MTVLIQAEPVTPGSCAIALVVSVFNREITQALQQGALDRWVELGFNLHDVTVVEVPGAIEIPLIAQQLARLERFDAIVALGAVIRGETSHYDYVCQVAANGCAEVALAHHLPVVFGVLTTENEAQAWDRLGGAHGHKGRDAIDCALSMHAVMQQLLG
jgi:6,7-dimethyl-8-ribityllumazine synthase